MTLRCRIRSRLRAPNLVLALGSYGRGLSRDGPPTTIRGKSFSFARDIPTFPLAYPALFIAAAVTAFVLYRAGNMNVIHRSCWRQKSLPKVSPIPTTLPRAPVWYGPPSLLHDSTYLIRLDGCFSESDTVAAIH